MKTVTWKRMRRWPWGRRCATCGKRTIRPCGQRASETVWIAGGYFAWKKFSPCAEINHDAAMMDPCGDLDDLSDCYA